MTRKDTPTLPTPPIYRAGDDTGNARRRRTAVGVSAAVAASAVAGSWLTDTDSFWYKATDTPDWQPPAWVFPVAWTGLYTGIAYSSTATLNELHERGEEDEARAYKRALAVNLALNAAWCGIFFRGKAPSLGTFAAAALTLSSADLARRAAKVNTPKALPLVAYKAWCAFATALTWNISRRND